MVKKKEKWRGPFGGGDFISGLASKTNKNLGNGIISYLETGLSSAGFYNSKIDSIISLPFVISNFLLTSRPILTNNSNKIFYFWPQKPFPPPPPPPSTLPQISIFPLWLINKKNRSLGGGAGTGQKKRKKRGHPNTLTCDPSSLYPLSLIK
jgi:hypothetical protein